MASENSVRQAVPVQLFNPETGALEGETAEDLYGLLHRLVERGASDLHLTVNTPQQ